jgi:hypothetical protein
MDPPEEIDVLRYVWPCLCTLLNPSSIVLSGSEFWFRPQDQLFDNACAWKFWTTFADEPYVGSFYKMCEDAEASLLAFDATYEERGTSALVVDTFEPRAYDTLLALVQRSQGAEQQVDQDLLPLLQDLVRTVPGVKYHGQTQLSDVKHNVESGRAYVQEFRGLLDGEWALSP